MAKRIFLEEESSSEESSSEEEAPKKKVVAAPTNGTAKKAVAAKKPAKSEYFRFKFVFLEFLWHWTSYRNLSTQALVMFPKYVCTKPLLF